MGKPLAAAGPHPNRAAQGAAARVARTRHWGGALHVSVQTCYGPAWGQGCCLGLVSSPAAATSSEVEGNISRLLRGQPAKADHSICCVPHCLTELLTAADSC